jgi:hypothetical protein
MLTNVNRPSEWAVPSGSGRPEHSVLHTYCYNPLPFHLIVIAFPSYFLGFVSLLRVQQAIIRGRDV